MKVGFTSYPIAFQRKGGLEVQIRQTANALRELGVDVEIVDLTQRKLWDFDLIHHFSHSSLRIFQVAQRTGVPCVLSPLVKLPPSTARMQIICSMSRWLHKIFGSDMRTPWLDVIDTLRLADAILPLTATEEKAIYQLLPEAATKTTVVPNGITDDFFAADETLFRSNHPELPPFVLLASNFAPFKNLLAVIRAARDEGYHTVLAGAQTDKAYFKECMKAGGDHATYVGELEYPSPMLTSLFAAARVVVLASKVESFGLVPFEALAAGTPSILTTASGVDRAGEPPYFQRVNPDSDSDIRTAIRTAMEAKPEPAACRHLVDDMHWTAVGERILGVYGRILSKKNRPTEF